jgi:hypothetical protein
MFNFTRIFCLPSEQERKEKETLEIKTRKRKRRNQRRRKRRRRRRKRRKRRRRKRRRRRRRGQVGSYRPSAISMAASAAPMIRSMAPVESCTSNCRGAPGNAAEENKTCEPS